MFIVCSSVILEKESKQKMPDSYYIWSMALVAMKFSCHQNLFGIEGRYFDTKENNLSGWLFSEGL